MPAVFKFITENSEFDKITLVAHSQGTSAALYGLVRQPEIYNKYLNLFVMVGPIARLSNTNSEVVNFASENANYIKFTTDMMGLREIF